MPHFKKQGDWQWLAQLAEKMLPIPEVLGLNPILNNFIMKIFTANC